MQGNASRLDLKDWVLIPGIITLAVTIIRLLGELGQGPSILFGAEPGGGASLVGIAWLALIFGVYFGYQLARQGYGPSAPLGRVLLKLLLALVVLFGGAILATAAFGSNPWISLPLLGAFSLAAVIVGQRAWPEAGRVLTAYGLVARIPVVIVMFFAIFGDWGTHYDGPPPGFPEMGPLAEWFLTGLIPQLTTWIAYTVILGGFAAVVGAALARR